LYLGRTGAPKENAVTAMDTAFFLLIFERLPLRLPLTGFYPPFSMLLINASIRAAPSCFMPSVTNIERKCGGVSDLNEEVWALEDYGKYIFYGLDKCLQFIYIL
jgi:hypothetical protein